MIALPDLFVGNIHSPPVAEPGAEIELEWIILNDGGQDAEGAWQTHIYLSDDSVIGNDQLLSTIDSAGIVLAGDATGLAQSALVQIPALDVNGEVWLVVSLQTNEAGQVFDADISNNTSITAQAVFIPIMLSLEVSSTSIKEDNPDPIRTILSRTGKMTDPLEVTLSSSDTTELITPDSVIIPAGHLAIAFNMSVVNDGVIDEDALVAVSAYANGAYGDTQYITVENVQLPMLAVELDKEEVVEGASGDEDRFNITITRDFVTDRSVSLELSVSSERQISLPFFAQIPANGPSVTVEGYAYNDSFIEQSEAVQIGASASGYNSAVASIQVHDDVPELTIGLGFHIVSEGDGPQALVGTVSRSEIVDEDLRIGIRSSDETEALVPYDIIIPAGQSDATFYVAAIDDQLVDGAQQVILTPFIVTTPYTDGVVVEGVTIEVLDNDGPALAIDIDKTLVAEASSWTERIWLSNDQYIGDDIPIGTFAFEGTISHTLGLNFYERTVPILAPLKSGYYWLVVETDVAHDVQEIIETNNALITTEPVYVQLAYMANVQTDIEQAPMGTPIPITGFAITSQGEPVPFALVNIHINVRQFERVIAAIADDTGHRRTQCTGSFRYRSGHQSGPG